MGLVFIAVLYVAYVALLLRTKLVLKQSQVCFKVSSLNVVLSCSKAFGFNAVLRCFKVCISVLRCLLVIGVNVVLKFLGLR